MKLNKISSLEEYNSLLERFYKKGCTSNNYMLPNEINALTKYNAISYISTENNIAFLVQKPKCKRVYYLINDFEQLFDFSDYNFVVEIIYRGEKFFPESEINFLKKCGFEVNLIRDQYSSMYKDLKNDDIPSNVDVCVASTINDVKYACELFNNTFDVFSGDFIDECEYDELLDNKSIILARCDGNVVGALHKTIEKNVVWLSHVAVEKQARGMHVGKSLLNFWIEQNKQTEKTRYMLWVQHQNIPAVKMYQNKGFKYLNKSTVSLIKKQK